MKISEIIDDYLIRFPKEKSLLSDLLLLKARFQSFGELIDRKNFDGHITSSAILVSRKTKKMLKIYNEQFNRYLQPGGHIKQEDVHPLGHSKRLLKGFGINNFAVFMPDSGNELIPLDIDTHLIPRNELLKEDEHYHHDFRYLFVCEDEFEVANKTYKWEDITELQKDETFVDLIDKVQFLWSKEYEETQFYNSIVESISIPKETTFIVVQHFLSGIDYFLKSLNSIGKIGAVIPKPKSIDEKIAKRISTLYHVVRLKTREELVASKDILNIIKNSEGSVVLIDIGGWFAPCLTKWSKKFPGKILGVVEDTENGFQKYENETSLPYPVISVARSPLKLNEDTLIGQSIVFSADSILRTQNKLVKYMTCGVIGYGKIGKSIAFDLITRSIKPIVYDKDPLKLIMAYNDGCSIGNKKMILKSSDAIFCATGNKSITTSNLINLKRGCYLFSVTSADDEFKISDIDKNYKCERVDEHIKRYFNFDNSLYIVNDGNAVNFIHKAVVGDFIHLVKAEMLVALGEFANRTLNNGIHELSIKQRKKISEKWLDRFQNIR